MLFKSTNLKCELEPNPSLYAKRGEEEEEEKEGGETMLDLPH